MAVSFHLRVDPDLGIKPPRFFLHHLNLAFSCALSQRLALRPSHGPP